MSSRKGVGSRAQGQKYQNAVAYKNDKYGATPQVKKANAKVHDGLCQRCKQILEWKVKYNKYKFLSQPRKCVKCLQKSVKDAYHIMCKPCALRLELCAKCGKNEDVVIPLDRKEEEEEEEEDQNRQGSSRKKRGTKEGDEDDEEFDDDDDLGELDGDCDSDAAGK